MIKLKYPPDYVLDSMEWYEVDAALKYQYYSYKEDWEQARMISYIVAQVNSKKRLKLEDIIKFPWDGKGGEMEHQISKEDIERLQQMAKNYEKAIKK